MRRRLDLEMVRRGLAPSRARASADVEAGRVLVGGAVADKAARMVSASEPIEIRQPARFVSRGGEKLDAALDRFAVDVAGRRCLDAGASTGGFTDCLLQRGAAHVIAVDVGHSQLHERIRGDARVSVMDGVNARTLRATDIGGVVEVVTADLSFISLRTVGAALAGIAGEDADVVVLVKPQFEAGRERVGRGGVVRDPDVHAQVLRDVRDALAADGLDMVAVMPSPLRGPAGNVEFLAHLRKDASTALGDDALSDAVARAHRDMSAPGAPDLPEAP